MSVLLAKQLKDYHRDRLNEGDNDSLVAYKHLKRHTSNSHLTYKVNNDDHDNFLREDGKGIWIEQKGNGK